MKFSNFLFLISVLGIASIGISRGQNKAEPGKDFNYEYMKQSERFQRVLRDLMTHYVDTINPEQLVKPAIQTMLGKLDPYTSYYTDKEVDDLQSITSGKYGGVGALIGKRGDKIRVIEAYEKSPADKIGLQTGDILLKIDQKVLDTMDVVRVSNLLRGTVGSTLDLEYQRLRTGDTVRIKITREAIQIPAVPYYGMLKGTRIAYLAFDNFSQNCSNEVRMAIQDLTKQGMEALILDLRGNGGGLVDEAIRIANLFLPKNKEIAKLKARLPENNFLYKTKEKPMVPDLPLAVLINMGSASSAEILAGALQDYDRAVLIGGNTYGKGLIQNILYQPYEARLKITTAKYYIPSGRCVQRLDYGHRNEDGSVDTIPDSLRKPFKTANGRTVYDGGGICPDIIIKDQFISAIGVSLIARGYLEDFGLQYSRTHEPLPNPEFEDLPKSILDEFEKYIEGKDYSYQTESQVRLMKLIEATKREKYYEAFSPLLDSLKTNLFHDKKMEFDLHKENIYTLLETVVYTGYEYRKGRFKLMLRKDPAVQKAKEILSNKSLYDTCFSVDKIIK